MGVLLAFLLGYAVLVAVVALGLGFALQRLAPRLRWARTGLALAVVAIACAPIPIHGGFTLLLPTLVSEAWREFRQDAASRHTAGEQAELDSRFEGYLPASEVAGRHRDEASGLVWSERVDTVSEVTPESLTRGQRLCAELAPRGYWVLPRTSEFFFLARALNIEGSWLAETFVMPGRSSIPSLARGRAAKLSAAGIGVRCVAVTPPAPERGYLTSDIPLDEWNRYQLGLLNASVP